MKFIQKLIEEILDANAIKGDYLVILAAAVILISFVVCQLVGGGIMSKNKSVASKAVNADKKGIAGGVDAAFAKSRMHNQSYRALRRAGKSPERFFPVESFVVVPYLTSLVKAAAFVVSVVTAFCAALAWTLLATKLTVIDSEPHAAAMCIILIGSVFALLSAIIGRVRFGGAMSKYNALMLVLRKGGSAPVEEEQEPVHEHIHVEHSDHEQVEIPVVEEESPIVAEDDYQPHVEADNSFFGGGSDFGFESETEGAGFAVEVEDNSAMEEAARIAAEEAAAAEAARAEEQARIDAEEAAARAAEQARLAEEEAARAAEEAARAAAQAAVQAAQEAARAAEEEAAARAAEEAAAAAAARATNAVTEDLLQRVDAIQTEGAPLETMREVAKLLQAERLKPENRNPEQQRRLNEALSSVLKMMSGARK